MKKIIIFLLTFCFLVCSCTEEKITESQMDVEPDSGDQMNVTPPEEEKTEDESYCGAASVDLTLYQGRYYYREDDGLYAGEIGRKAALCRENTGVFGVFNGVLFVQSGNEILAEKDGAWQTVFSFQPEEGVVPFKLNQTARGERLLIFCQDYRREELQDGAYTLLPTESYFYLDVNTATLTATQHSLNHKVDGALLQGDLLYYVREFTLFAGETATGESRELCRFSRQEWTPTRLYLAGTTLLAYGENGQLALYHTDTGRLEEPELKNRDSAEVVNGVAICRYNNGRDYWIYDLVAKEQKTPEEIGLITAEGTAHYAAENGILHSTYDYATGYWALRAVVGGEEHVAYIDGKNAADIVNAVFDETGVAVRTRDGKLYTALWN